MRIPGYINYGYRPPAPFVAAAILLRQLGTREFKKEEAERLMKLVKEVMKNVT